MLTRLTNKLPGRTEPLVNPAINGDRWAECRRALRRRDQPRFDQLFEYAREHADASGLLNHQNPLVPALFSIDLEEETTLEDREERIEALERRLNEQNADLQVLDKEASEPPNRYTCDDGIRHRDDGFSMTNQLTIVNLDAEIGSRIFLNTAGGACVSDIEERVDDHLTTPVTLSANTVKSTRRES